MAITHGQKGGRDPPRMMTKKKRYGLVLCRHNARDAETENSPAHHQHQQPIKEEES